MYGDIGKQDNEDDDVNISSFDEQNYSLSYDEIFRIYARCQNIALKCNMDRERFLDCFYEDLIQNGCRSDEADSISETFNPS